MGLWPEASALAPVGARPVRRPRLDAVLAAGSARSGAPTGEFYALPHEEARNLLADGVVDPISREPLPAGATRDDDDATFRLPLPESAPKNADGSYKYRVYDAASLWELGQAAPASAVDPLDRTPLLRQRLGGAARPVLRRIAAHPTPPDTRPCSADPITSGLWPPGVPYVAAAAAAADRRHASRRRAGSPWRRADRTTRTQVYGPIAGWDVRNVTKMRDMFWNAAAFNGDLSGWDVRNVTDMRRHVSGRRGLQRRPGRLGRAQRHEHEPHVLPRRGLQRRPERVGRAQRHDHGLHVCSRRGLQRRPERLGRAQRHGHERHV